MSSLEGIRRPVALAEEVYSRLYDQLMTHCIAPGARLSVDGLARTLNVSQTPIREALARLEAQGLVVKTHLVGYRVAKPVARERLDQIYEMRLLTEPRLAALAAERISSDSRRELLAIAAQMEAAGTLASAENYARFSRLDDAFHQCIAAASGNLVIADALAALHVHVHLFRLSRPPTAIADAVLEHGQVLEAIVAGNARAAEEAMLRHILHSRRRFAEDGSKE